MDHLSSAAGVNWCMPHDAFGELLAAAPQLYPMELDGLNYGRPYHAQTFGNNSTPSDALHYGQESVGELGGFVFGDCGRQEETVTQAKPSQARSAPVEKKRTCYECGATFACVANLRNHMRIHTGERPFVCEDCGATFTQRSNMRSHRRIHTGERPYMCGICGQTFSRASHLPGHLRSHTGEKPFSCPHCSRPFATIQMMKNHMRIHTGERPFVCEFCNATFAQSSCLATHKKIHTGERNYKCKKCDKAFISRSGLQSHERVHTWGKPFSCDKCLKSFRSSSYLSKHRQKYCGIEALQNIEKQPKVHKVPLTPADTLKGIKGKKVPKRTGKPPIKRTRVNRPQNLNESRNTALTPLDVYRDDSELWRSEEEGHATVENYANQRGYGNVMNENVIATVMSATGTNEEVFRSAYARENILHPTAEHMNDGSEAQKFPVSYTNFSQAVEESNIRMEEHSFSEDIAYVRDENTSVIPLTEYNMLELSDFHSLKLKHQEEMPFGGTRNTFSDFQQHNLTNAKHQLIPDYSIENNSPCFAKGTYEDTQQSLSQKNVENLVCEDLFRLLAEPTNVPQQAGSVKDSSAMFYSTSFT